MIGMNQVPSFKKITPLLLSLALVSCGKNEFDSTGGVKVVRSSCPAIAIPANTGDITLFNPAESRTADAIDVVATITNLKTSCNDTAGDRIVANVSFDVLARRSSASGPREVVLPYFSIVMRSGTTVLSKQVGRVAIRFEDGQLRGSGRGTAAASIAVSEAKLPPEIEERINRKRKVGDEDAAIDPMSDPKVRDAVRRASFELLVGFQLTESQLAYNATR